LCSKEQIKSYRFISTWRLINNDNIFIFEDKRQTILEVLSVTILEANALSTFPSFFFPHCLSICLFLVCLANRCLNLALISQKASTGAFANLYHKIIEVRAKTGSEKAWAFQNDLKGKRKSSRKGECNVHTEEAVEWEGNRSSAKLCTIKKGGNFHYK